MTYAKLINESTIDINPPRRAIIDGHVVTGELPLDYLMSIGFYLLEKIDKPEYDPPEENCHWESRYEFDSEHYVI